MFLLLSFGHNPRRVQANQDVKMSGVTIAGAEPFVPLLGTRLQDAEIGGFGEQGLDGVNCVNCSLNASVITYAGGMFSCDGCNIQAKQLKLKGAALNTYNALVFLGLIPAPEGPRPPVVQKDPTQKATFGFRPQQHVVWISTESTK
jgi:hypothetical protein